MRWRGMKWHTGTNSCAVGLNENSFAFGFSFLTSSFFSVFFCSETKAETGTSAFFFSLAETAEERLSPAWSDEGGREEADEAGGVGLAEGWSSTMSLTLGGSASLSLKVCAKLFRSLSIDWRSVVATCFIRSRFRSLLAKALNSVAVSWIYGRWECTGAIPD